MRRVALFALVALLAASCADQPGPEDRSAPAAATTAETEPEASTTVPGVLGAQLRSPLGSDSVADLTSDQIATPEARDGLYGWGAWQPAQMNRPLVAGTSDAPLSPERRAQLGLQLEAARAAALEVGTVAKAEAAGYQKLHEFATGRGYEYANFDLIDDTFEIDRPEILAFPDDAPDAGIAAIAFYVTGDVESGPPDDLPLEAIPWHSHWAVCQDGGEFPLSQDPTGCIEDGGKIRSDLDGWMVDLWIIPGWENPWGLVSSRHPDLMTQP